MSDRVHHLEREVKDLRLQLELLQADFDHLRRQLRTGRFPAGSDSRSPARELSVHLSEGTEDSYSVVSSRAGAYPAPSAARYPEESHEQRLPRTSPSSSASGRSPPFAPAAAPAPSAALSWAEREDIADQIGRFISRCLQGQHRGTSGRDLNPLPSRLWLVARDFEGQIYSPIRVFKSWGSCRNLCKRYEDPGDSVFVGVPSEREARRVVIAAGLDWPAVIER